MNNNPNWQNRSLARDVRRRAADPAATPAEPVKPKVRDYAAEAKATLNAADQQPGIIAAVIVAQALERFGKEVVEAAAISNYKRV